MINRNNNDFISRRENTWRQQEPASIWRRNQNTVAFAHSAKLGPVSHTVLVAVMVAVLGLIYLTQITKTSGYGYTIEGLSVQKSELLAKKSELEVESARLKSLQKIQSSEVAKTLSAPTTTDYVR